MEFAELITYKLGQRGAEIVLRDGLQAVPIGHFSPGADCAAHAQKIVPEILPALALLDSLVVEVDMTYPAKKLTELAIDWPDLHNIVKEARALLKRAGAA